MIQRQARKWPHPPYGWSATGPLGIPRGPVLICLGFQPMADLNLLDGEGVELVVAKSAEGPISRTPIDCDVNDCRACVTGTHRAEAPDYLASIGIQSQHTASERAAFITWN